MDLFSHIACLIALIFCLFLGPTACRSETVSTAGQSETTAPITESPLEIQIQKLLSQETHDTEALKNAVRAKSWDEILTVFEAVQSKIQPPVERMSQVKAKLVLSSAHHDTRAEGYRSEAEASRERQKEIVKQIKKDLQEMADEENLEPR